MKKHYILPAFVLVSVLGGAGYLLSGGMTTAALAANSPAATQTTAPATAEAPAATPAALTPAINAKVADVGGDVITKADVEQLYNSIKQRAGENAPPLDQVFWMLTDQIIASRLIIKQATDDKLDSTPDVQTALKQAHEQILQEAYVRKLFTGLDSEAALKPAYDKMVASFKGQEEVHARHILVKSEDEAKALIAKLTAGGDFAQLAKENTQDPGSKENGGDLGFFAKDAMVPEFATAAFALQAGKVSPTPVHTQFGWHVIKVEERRARSAPSFEEAKAQLVSQAQQDKLQSTIESLRSAAKVQRFAAEGTPAVPADAPAPAAAPAAGH